ncbi:early nodulin-like protein 8 [Actinidia rufa]|uniref:Early nodulin-like protein 8 n=1 Tax=Actinidia rufa TaxID=165716 RepID=A0A7J0H1S3_9ERIC|nr:early nodulin-like protein 8 [Actinidia rufa]
MLGDYPLQQIQKSTPTGPRITSSRLETLSCFCTRQVKIVIQVTEQSYNSCNLKDPILYSSSPSYGPGSLPVTAPSYPIVFGSIPMAPLSSPSSSSLINPAIFLSASIGFLICAIVSGFI